MYRPGLGDCFLLTFTSGNTKSHILIDCGIFVGTADEKARISQIAQHILTETDQRVNALVATHEHWDHVAGFHYARSTFDQLQTEEIWVAWTEDPDQTIAQENKKMHAMMLKTLGLAIERLYAAPATVDRECGVAAARVLGFEGLAGDLLGTANFSRRSDEAMAFVSRRKNNAQPFLKPGQVLERSWLPGVRVYVLGPPMDLDAIRDMKGAASETFESKHHGVAMGWMSAVMLGARQNEIDVQERELAERLRPFDVTLAWPESDAITLSQNKKTGTLYESYQSQDWRRIDHDWLQSAAHLALQVDNAVNNTCLVLAFELIETGEVLLFVGDAQVGNWQSWMDLQFTIGQGSDRRTISAKELLARTVFYKVGHHGSGNATLRAGLEAMTSEDLMAAIPTDETFARETKGWEMPAPKLWKALSAKTKGRILRADPGHDAIPTQKPENISQAAWDRFRQAVTQAPLFVDYEL
jgi:hypothetical protein